MKNIERLKSILAGDAVGKRLVEDVAKELKEKDDEIEALKEEIDFGNINGYSEVDLGIDTLYYKFKDGNMVLEDSRDARDIEVRKEVDSLRGFS